MPGRIGRERTVEKFNITQDSDVLACDKVDGDTGVALAAMSLYVIRERYREGLTTLCDRNDQIYQFYEYNSHDYSVSRS